MSLRPYTDADFDAVFGLLDAASRHWRGEPASEGELRTWLTMPTLDRANDIRLLERSGELVGYADVDHIGEEWWCDVELAPGADAATVAPELLAWIESRARGGRIRVWAPAKDASLRACVERAGFTVRRHSFSMEVDLDGDLPEPVWPDGISVRTFREGDASVVYEAEREIWLDTWAPLQDTYEEWAHWSFAEERFDPALWHLAEADGELAALAKCARSDNRPDTGWVDILGVRRPWRRRGLGEALLKHAFRVFHARGLTRAGLGVDAESPTGATRLYERAGMRVYHETVFYEKDAPA